VAGNEHPYRVGKSRLAAILGLVGKKLFNIGEARPMAAASGA
jgi:hypothetical protein